MPSASRLVILEDVLPEGRVCLKALQKSLAPDLLLSVITLVYRAYLTVSQLSTGLKDFSGTSFLRTAKLKKNQFFLVCCHIPKKFAERVIDGMKLLKTESCRTPTLYFYIQSLDRRHKTVQGA